MKKLLVVLLTLSLLVGMFSFAAFADQGNISVNSNANSSANSEKDKNNEASQGSGSTVHVIPSMDSNANTMNALLNKDAALDRSVGNTEDNSDKVWNSYLKVFKHSSDNKKDSKLSSTLSFTKFIELRKTANKNWDDINRLNKEIKKAFDKYRASLRGLSKADADKAMNDMKLTLNADRVKIAAAHVRIKELRSQKEIQWKAFRVAVKAGVLVRAQAILNGIVDLKQDIIDQQGFIKTAKESIKSALIEGMLDTIPAKAPAVPTFSPEAGVVLTGTSITIKSPGADIYYTTNAAIVLLNTSTLTKYTEKFLLIEPTTTVRAIAYRNGVPSTLRTAVYYAQDYATAPTSYAITVGAIGTTLTGPAAGATTKGAVTGWVKDGIIKFTVVDAPSIAPAPSAKSTITINGRDYTSGASYSMVYIHSNHESYHHMVIVVTTKQTDRITAVRTFMIEIKK